MSWRTPIRSESKRRSAGSQSPPQVIFMQNINPNRGVLDLLWRGQPRWQSWVTQPRTQHAMCQKSTRVIPNGLRGTRCHVSNADCSVHFLMAVDTCVCADLQWNYNNYTTRVANKVVLNSFTFLNIYWQLQRVGRQISYGAQPESRGSTNTHADVSSSLLTWSIIKQSFNLLKPHGLMRHQSQC
jgi:hypothetical protein